MSRLQPHNYEIVLYNVASPSHARAMVAEIPDHEILEALIVISLPLSSSEAKLLAGASFPTVLLDTTAPGLPTVCIDDRHGGAIATQHLLDLGHCRTAFVGEPPDNSFGFVSSARSRGGCSPWPNHRRRSLLRRTCKRLA